MFLFCIIYPVFLEKQVSNQKKHIFSRILYCVINLGAIQKNDIKEAQEEINKIQEAGQTKK
jgi:hypothetical protein